jgi:hypothetical protein
MFTRVEGLNTYLTLCFYFTMGLLKHNLTGSWPSVLTENTVQYTVGNTECLHSEKGKTLPRRPQLDLHSWKGQISWRGMVCTSKEGNVPQWLDGSRQKVSRVLVVHASNPSYSRSTDKEDRLSKPAQANGWQDPILKKPFTRKGWWSGSRSRAPA